MRRLIAVRLLLLGPMLLAVSLAVFTVLRLGRGDPALDYLRISGIPPSDAALLEARRLLGLDRPLPEQYWSWLADAARLDFGRSYVTGRPVLDEILHHLPATLQLAGVSLLVTLAFSVPLGLWAALRRDRWPDRVARGLAFVGVSVPNFWLGFLLVLLFSVTLGWLPAMGRGGWQHMVMPVLAVSLMSLCINTRLVRAAALEVLNQRHVLYARLRGLPEHRVLTRHVLRNALVPVVTATGMHLGELLGGTMVVESIFGWPGIGRLAVSAIHNRDYPVLQGFILLMTVVFVLCNLAVDIAGAWIDPRQRRLAMGGRREFLP
ncbi:nickel ABC transporter permease subunit NikB [Azospirillum sp. SYSU D00513]|uniref:nickel ABC transporter permease subunit NikB n=1 Tax=Azospirillum sp. SYSU D00513 TaxID=2812561 RepID=UPI001A9726DA|nr:nickel ABC transporter permease subunit NikB [Azospirillum sp. SYSU D00513]